MDHSLLIPVEGLAEVFVGELAIGPILRARGEGAHAAVNLSWNGNHIGWVHWLIGDQNLLNVRARHAVSELCGAHIVLYGPVLITGLPEDKVFEIVAGL